MIWTGHFYSARSSQGHIAEGLESGDRIAAIFPHVISPRARLFPERTF